MGLDTASARELRNYLYQMQEQLEYILSNIDTEWPEAKSSGCPTAKSLYEDRRT